MNAKSLLTALLFVLTGNILVNAQTITCGALVNTESKVVSGKPYLLYYLGNGNCYVIAENDYFRVAGVTTPTLSAIYYFQRDNDGKYTIQSRENGTYFPVPTSTTYTAFNPVSGVENAGHWTLNFQSNGNIRPHIDTYYLNRSNYILHAFGEKTDGTEKLRIYEIALSTTATTTATTDFSGKIVTVGNSAETPTTGKWYVVTRKSDSNYFIDSSADSYTTPTAPTCQFANSSKYLVRLVSDGSDKYFVETAYGNYLFHDGSNYITTAVSAQSYTISELTAVFDFYPVTAATPLTPTASELYIIKTDANAGDDQRWIFSPTGYGTGQYYLYNTAQKKFAYPSTSGSWITSTAAVPVVLEPQVDGHYRIVTKGTKDGTAQAFRIGSVDMMNITQDGTPTSTMDTELYNAQQELIGAYTKITEASQITDGWYALRIKSDSEHPEFDGNFLYTLEQPYDGGGTIFYPYPVGHGGAYDQHPAKDNTTYYFRLWPIVRSDGNTYYHWQLPNGIYIVNYLNNYPIQYHQDLSDFIIGQNSDGTFYIQSSNFRAQAAKDEGRNISYIGKTARKFMESTTKLEIYKKELTDVGLVAWKLINKGADDVPVTCTRTDVSGSNVAYNGGYYLLPDIVTPIPSDFTMENMYGSPVIDTVNKTITVTYAPGTCFTAEDVNVVQGSRTTGIGNTRQVLLRIEVVPKAPCHPQSFSVTLKKGASQISQLQAWLTSSDQLDAEGVVPVPLGTQTTVSDNVTIDVSDPTNDNNLMGKDEKTYLWITADIDDEAFESETIDAKVTAIGYQNVAASTSCDITAKGDPDGEMRIFLRQQYVRVSTATPSIESYYRNPAILRDGSNLLAFCEYRYDNVLGLGKDYDDTDYGHRIDVLMFKSTNNGGSWITTPVTVAAGTDGDATHEPSGFAGPAVVRCNSGKLICLTAMGNRSYDSSTGLRHIGYTYSSDGGTTWSTPTDIWGSINWNGLSTSSAYVTPGKGVTFSNGRVAFVLNAKSGNGQTNEYVLYSDDEGGSWNIAPSTTLFGNSKYGKLEVMNDDRLLATVSRGADTSLDGRGYNLTTGDATGSGITEWEESDNWGSNLNSYGCNNDIFYFGRSPEAAGIRDAILHTVIKGYSAERFKDLRLYTNFKQAAADSWKEMFTVTPYNAAASSMQKTSDGHLAVFFEDGSIGNAEKDGCYALNCVVISKELIEAQMTDLYTAKVISIGDIGSLPDVTWGDVGTGNWAKKVTTKSTTGVAGVVVSAEHWAFNRESNSTQRVLCVKPSAANTTDVITITAPDGYIIKSYTITGYNKASGETYTLTAADGTTEDLTGGSTQTLTVDNIYKDATTFSFKSNSNTNNSYALVTQFHIELAKEYSVELHQVNTDGNGDQKSYATLYVPFDLQQTDNKTKAYYVSEVMENGRARLLPVGDDGRQIHHRTAVVLINESGVEHVSFAVTSGLSQLINESDNKLKGTLEGRELDLRNSANNSLYTLGRRRYNLAETGQTPDWSPWVAGFYKTNTILNLAANRAYLDTTVPPDTSGSSRGFDFLLDDDGTTGIALPLPSPEGKGGSSAFPQERTAFYTLDGRRVSGTPTAKGIYVKNGQKYVIK